MSLFQFNNGAPQSYTPQAGTTVVGFILRSGGGSGAKGGGGGGACLEAKIAHLADDVYSITVGGGGVGACGGDHGGTTSLSSALRGLIAQVIGGGGGSGNSGGSRGVAGFTHSACYDVNYHDGGLGGGWYEGNGSLMDARGGGGGGNGTTTAAGGDTFSSMAPNPGNPGGGKGAVPGLIYEDPAYPGSWGGGGGGGHHRYANQGAAGGAGFVQIVGT